MEYRTFYKYKDRVHLDFNGINIRIWTGFLWD